MRLFSTAGIPVYIPPVMVGWSPFLLILCFSNFLFCLFCVLLDLIILIPGEYDAAFHCGFGLHLFNDLYVKHLFYVLVGYFYGFFGEMSV